MSDEPLMTAEQAAVFLQKSVHAFYAWRRRHGVPNRMRGRGFRCFKSDLLAARGPEPKPAAALTREDIREMARRHARGETTTLPRGCSR